MSSLYGSALYDTSTYDGVGVGDPVVELFLNGSWVAVTSYVRVAEGIQIRRGRQDWSQGPTFATCDLTLDNRDGRFSPRNTSGAYYPYLVRNTPLRVSVYKDDGTTTVRFWGDVSSWPVTVVGMGADLTTAIQGSGLRRRLQTNAIPLQSPYRLAVGGLSNVVAYWPLEDGDTATSFSSGIPSGRPMSATGGVEGAGDSDAFTAASTPLAVLSGVAGVTGNVPTYTPSVSGVQVRMLVKSTSSGADGMSVFVHTSGAHYFLFQYSPATTLGTLAMINYATNAVEATNGPFITDPLSVGVRFSIELKQNGTGIDCNVVYLVPGATSGLSFGIVTIPTATLGVVTAVQVAGSGATSEITLGHVSVENNITSIFDLAKVLTGYAGETAAARALRLSTLAGVSTGIDAGAGGVTTELMGPQGESTFLELFDETASVDGGVSTESVSSRSLRFRPRSSLYSQAAHLAFTVSVLDDLQAVDDDQLTVNDVTAARPNGGSANYMVTSGNLSVASIGDYAQQVDLNVFADTQLLPQAQWRATVGTVDEPRWAVLAFDAIRLTNGLGARDLLISMREGDRFQITGVPQVLGMDANRLIDSHVLGWTETITDTAWLFEFNTSPATPYSLVFILDSATFGILDTDRLGL